MSTACRRAHVILLSLLVADVSCAASEEPDARARTPVSSDAAWEPVRVAPKSENEGAPDAGASAFEPVPDAADSGDVKPSASEPAAIGSDARPIDDALAVDAAVNTRPHGSDGGTPMSPARDGNAQPLAGVRGRWTYTELPETSCRDGSPAGLGINLGAATRKLMMFFEGGGYCIDEQTCSINPPNTVAQVLLLGVGESGVFDRNNPENPLRDWNFVYVPYCTGDRHGGANLDGNIPNVGRQRFVGYLNVQKYLERLVATFPDLTDLLVTGISAGGFGSLKNSLQVQRAFPNVKVKVVDDSGPPASEAVLSTCLQRAWRIHWRLDQTILADCGAACPDHDDYWQDYGAFVAQSFRDRPSGLVVAIEDVFERAFFGVGSDDCTGALDVLNPRVSASALREDLLGFRGRVAPLSNFGTFYPDNNLHTWVGGSAFYTVRAGDMRLVDWFTRIVNGQAPGHVGP